ncbi:MAG: outer membrane protein transport protein [Alphaproteobacteria bacterium]|nr:outer membrane protein transport protein [Alphaproteobacteria bacterium]
MVAPPAAAAALIRAALLVCGGLAAGPALAGNDRSYHMGAEAATTAAAGLAVTDAGEAAWYNPAGLGGLTQTRLSVNASAFTLRIRGSSDFVRTSLGDGARDAPGVANQFTSVPTAVVIARGAPRRVGWGLALLSPQGGRLVLRSTLEDTAQPQDWDPAAYRQSLQVFAEDQTYYAGAGVGWQATDDLKIGGCVFFVYQRRLASFSFQATLDGVRAGQPTTLFASYAQDGVRNVLGLNFAVSLQWQFVPDWWIGLVVRTMSFGIAQWGEITSSGATNFLGDAQDARVIADGARAAGVEWGFQPFEPMRFSLSVGVRRPRFWVGLEGEAVLGQTEAPLSPARNAMWNLALGGRAQAAEKVWIGAGLFTDQNGSTEQGLFADRLSYYGVTFGPELRTPLAMRDRDEPLVFSTTLGVRYALGFGSYGQIAFRPFEPGQLSARERTLFMHELQVILGTSVSF